MRPRPFRGAVLLSLSLLASDGWASQWTRSPRVEDARFGEILDLTSEAALGDAVIALQAPMIVDGRVVRMARVGAGWIELAPEFPGADPSPPHRFQFDAGDARIGPGTKVIASTSAASTVIRFIDLETAQGAVIAEFLLDAPGRITRQHLRAPGGPEAWHVELARTLPLGPRSPNAKSGGPGAPDCAAAEGTWCDAADGPGDLALFLDETFDDGRALSRGWSADGAWRPSSSATCGNGASGAGGAFYFGDPVTCRYPDRSSGSLISPVVGPLTPRSELRFLARLDAEVQRDGSLADVAEILVDGVVAATLPGDVDPLAWYSFTLRLGAWSGTSVRVGFRFTSDGREHQQGWFVDDVIIVDPSTGKPACRLHAGRHGATPCESRSAEEWRFDEERWCEGCAYSFYVLVECGREMHLSLRDMEGADIRVVNLADPTAPPSLRCMNEAARGKPPSLILRDGAGQPLDCCGSDGQPEAWSAPPMDLTDSHGPGRVAWGMDDACPTQSIYDVGSPGLSCDELPPTCGGILDRISPGEEQVVDCFIGGEAEGGACGLYRVDVLSGGNAWSLFANCDGSATPRFPMFFDCGEAWAAFQPLPELVVADLRVDDACGVAVAEVSVRNEGCAGHRGDVEVAFTWEANTDACATGGMRGVLPGPLAAGETGVLRVPLPAGCRPASITATIDPEATIAECTESNSAASCAADAGANARAAEGCACASSPRPIEVRDDRMRRASGGLALSWASLPGAATYLVARGSIGDWDSARVDALRGIGSCDTGGEATFLDRSGEPGAFYYLVAAVDACGIAGSLGSDSLGQRRPESPGCW